MFETNECLRQEVTSRDVWTLFYLSSNKQSFDEIVLQKLKRNDELNVYVRKEKKNHNKTQTMKIKPHFRITTQSDVSTWPRKAIFSKKILIRHKLTRAVMATINLQSRSRTWTCSPETELVIWFFGILICRKNEKYKSSHDSITLVRVSADIFNYACATTSQNELVQPVPGTTPWPWSSYPQGASVKAA